MQFPYYSQFAWAIAKKPSHRTTWHQCKEYAGRALSNRNPKRYVTVTLWTGWKPGMDDNSNQFPRIDALKAMGLENHLNELSLSFGCTERFRVSTTEHDGCLHIKVPPAWCHNRVITHLFFTHVRKFLRATAPSDDQHLANATDLLEYGKKVGIAKFNDTLRQVHRNNYRVLGIVQATAKWKQNLEQGVTF